MSSVIITVVVVLGIIVAGGFLLYFMGDLIMSLSHKKKDEKTITNNLDKQNKELEERINALEKKEEIKKDPEFATILYNGAVVENYNPDEEKEESVEPDEKEVENEDEIEQLLDEQAEQEESEENEAEENETEEEVSDDASEFIRQRRQELMERLARMQAMDEETAEEEESVDLTDSEQNEEEEVQEVPAVEEEVQEEEPKVEDAVQNQIFEENKEDKNALASNLSLEELQTRLAETQDRLKANEKELRKCKKEFIPLRRVKKTLENDEKKLRRKEALVAKQKVVLYGVNNYADIDEEKAKKLEEDLDLLEGLKLSVQHCEEVMEKNAERYPLLEKIFNLLSSQNAELKEDIKKLQEAIESINSSDDTTADAE